MKSYVWLDEKSKRITWLNKNYFFVTTVFITLLNIIVYAVHSSDTGDFYVRPDWGSFSLNNLFQALVDSYTHANWQHCLLNMLCFFIAGIYLERKQGSLHFILFMIIMSLFTAFASCTNDDGIGAIGFSAVNYGLYGYILLEFPFAMIQKKTRYLFNIISGAVVIALIYFAMCFCGGTETVSFQWYPYDLLNNLGHASGFVTGLIFGAYEQISSCISKAKNKPPAND